MKMKVDSSSKGSAVDYLNAFCGQDSKASYLQHVEALVKAPPSSTKVQNTLPSDWRRSDIGLLRS